MNALLLYLLKVVAVHGLLWWFYRWALHGSSRHALNRAYLLGAVMVAFLIPLIELPVWAPVAAPLELMEIWVVEPGANGWMELVPVVQSQKPFSWWQLILWIYGVVSAGLLLRAGTHLLVIRQLKKQSEYVSKQWFQLFKTTHRYPFSFFSNVFIPRAVFGTGAFEPILAHECVHVRQGHSYDRLLIDLAVSLFWFNPFIYWYRNALIEIHEYQADAAVVRRFRDPIGYQEILFSQLQPGRYALVSHFNFSMIKKRIVMMNKPKNVSVWRHVLTIPFIAVVIFAFSSKEMMRPLDAVGQEIVAIVGPVPSSLSAWEKQETPDWKPSILPVRDSEMVRMSSRFGVRKHPVSGEEKHHNGMDFVVPIGTEVLATADGTVKEVATHEGYGQYVRLQHGDQYETLYAQLSAFRVKVGDRVKKGQVIALSGNSGQSTGPHLHYEVVEIGKGHVNPLHFIHNFTFKSSDEPKKQQVGSEEEAEAQMAIAEEAADQAELAAESAALAEIQAAHAMEEAVKAANQAALARMEAETIKAQVEVAVHEAEEAALQARSTMVRVTTGMIEVQDPDQQPLFIVDGEEVSDFDDIDPVQIERIEVIKGESARNKYGESGKNGVIMIYTKDKQKNKSKDKQKSKSKD